MKMQLNMFIYFILCPFTEIDFLMLFRLIVADLFCFFSKIKWKSDLNSPEGFWASSASDCSLTIVLCAHLPSTCTPGVSCIFYKTAFVQESLIRSLVTCWGCFPFNALGFSPRQCQRRESEAHFHTHTHTCLSFPHCTCIKTQKSQNINSATGFNSAQIQTAMHQHTLTHNRKYTHWWFSASCWF